MTPSRIKLYNLELSGHAHRARLMASLLNIDVEIVDVDLLNGAHKQAEYLAKNPFGQVPTLEDGDALIYDSNAILVYLATKYDASRTWLPTDPTLAAEVQIWLAKAANEQAHGLAAARLITVFNAPLSAEETKAKSYALLDIINAQLTGRDWLVSENPTIADIALYTYTAHSPEGGVDLKPYPNVTAWLKRIESLPGFSAMSATETAEKKALEE